VAANRGVQAGRAVAARARAVFKVQQRDVLKLPDTIRFKPDRHRGVLEAYDAEAFGGEQGDHPWKKIKALILTGYYTSEIGITQEREYLPIPGEYDGAYPYAKVKRIFSS
jgi:hypothetical protein